MAGVLNTAAEIRIRDRLEGRHLHKRGDRFEMCFMASWHFLKVYFDHNIKKRDFGRGRGHVAVAEVMIDDQYNQLTRRSTKAKEVEVDFCFLKVSLHGGNSAQAEASNSLFIETNGKTNTE